MSVIVLSPHPHLKVLLKEVFSLLKIESEFFDAPPESVERYDLVITDFEDYLSQLSDHPLFFISTQEHLEDYKAEKIVKMPVRVGNLCDEILYFLKQKQITHDLKPIKLGRAMLYPNESALENKQGKIKLTDKEMNILLHLAAQHPQKIARNDLLDHVWGYADGVETHTLETHIYRLRQKIEIDPARPQFLMTDDDGYFLNI